MKSNALLILISLAFYYSPHYVFGQISSGGTPFTWIGEKSNIEIPSVVMHSIDIGSLKTEDEIDQQSKDMPFRFAYGFNVGLTTANSGKWIVLENGDRLWMLEIESPGAMSLNITFSHFYIPDGSRLFIYSPDKHYKAGAFTSFNNKNHHHLGTVPIPGDKIILEYYEPASVAFAGVLEIETVAHAYRDIFTIAKDFEKGYGDADDCNNDVVCPEAAAWEKQVRSVALITLGNGTRFCTGSLLNNVTNDGTPLFLTANHCTEGQTVSTMVFIFNYQSDICDPDGQGNDGSFDNSISGATILAHTNSPLPGNSTDPMDSDMALLLLSESPPEDYNVFYNGWDNSGNIPSNTTCIHHPEGDVKKITWDFDPPQISGYFDLGGNGGGTTHWRIVNWDDGTTEAGSSGSPLFNENKRVIGQLHGGQASCSFNSNDYYGRLFHSFQFIAQWLDPNNTGATSILGWPGDEDFPIDAGINAIRNIKVSYCEENSIFPEIILVNQGMTPFTSLDIDYFLNNSQLGTFTWTGNLNPSEAEIIGLGEIPLNKAGIQSFSVSIDLAGDGNPGNNDRSKAFYLIRDGIGMVVDLLTDSFAAETAWSIQTKGGYTLASNGPLENNTHYNQVYCVPDTCVDFIILDSFGDGICCGFGEGAYKVTLEDGTLLASGGEFASDEKTEICLPDFHEPPDLDNIANFYPNPVVNVLNVNFIATGLKEVNIRLIDISGKVVMGLTITNPSGKQVINMEKYSQGLYVLDIRSKAGGHQAEKLFVK